MTAITRGLQRRAMLAAAAAAALCLAAPASAQAPQFFRIGTGAAGGTYYPVGGMIANAISCPPGAPCREAGGTAGVPNLVAVAQATQSSVQNVNLIQSGAAESGFSQSDVAHWAYTATGLFEGRPKLDRLRFIAHLFGEQLHAVVRRDSPIQRLEDLRGKRVVVGLQASGARIGSELVLDAAGLRGAYTPEVLSAAQGVERMQDRGVDAVLQVVAAPAAAFTEFCSRVGCRLLPFSDAVIETVSQRAPFYSRGVIARGTYEGGEGGDRGRSDALRRGRMAGRSAGTGSTRLRDHEEPLERHHEKPAPARPCPGTGHPAGDGAARPRRGPFAPGR